MHAVSPLLTGGVVLARSAQSGEMIASRGYPRSWSTTGPDHATPTASGSYQVRSGEAILESYRLEIRLRR